MQQNFSAQEQAPVAKPVFVSIECSAFSGATLLSFLLGTHPQIATIGEMDGLIPRENPDEYLCSCGQKIKGCEFWQAVRQAMNRRGFEFDPAHFKTKFVLGRSALSRRLWRGSFGNNTLDAVRDTAFYFWPQTHHQLDALMGRNVAFIESVLEVTGRNIFVDTSKDFLRAKHLRKAASFDVRVIHLVRDIRGVVASRLRRKSELTVEKIIRQWVKENKRFQRTLQTFPKDKQMVIRYDDLCLDTEKVLKRICCFCGADPNIVVTDFRATTHHIIGNAMRLNGASEIKLDQRWKTSLTAEQLAEVDKLAGALNRQFGY